MRRVQNRRDRRGATLVFVAFLSVALVVFGALAVDVSRLYMGRNELQTAADAAALRGALHLQKLQTDPTAEVVAFALNSARAFNGPIAVENSDVTPIFWDPADPTSPDTVDWSTANAVEVRTRQPAGLLFGRILTSVAPVPQRRAIAWIANIAAVDCYRPFGISMSVIEGKLGSTLNSQLAINTLTEWAKTETGKSQLTVIMSPEGGGSGSYEPADGYFDALTGLNNSSPNSYAALMSGSLCNSEHESTIGEGITRLQPGQGAQIVNQGHTIFQSGGPCASGNAAGDAVCYDPATGLAGSEIVIPFVAPLSPPENTRVQMRMLSKFKLMCVFPENLHGNPHIASTAECPWLSRAGIAKPTTGYRPSTIVGYPIGGSVPLGSGTQLGNTLGTAQRLILVH